MARRTDGGHGDPGRRLGDAGSVGVAGDSFGGSKTRGRGERGVAVIEFAIVLPVFVALLLGLISSAIVLNQKIQLTHAVREGARHGATVPAGQTFSSGTWATNVREVVVTRSAGDLTAPDVCVALVASSPPVPLDAAHTTNSDGSACFDDSLTGGSEPRVQVVAKKKSTFEAVVVSQELTLESKATSMLEPDV